MQLILLTPFAKTPSESDLRSAGIAACRHKPVRQSNLLECIINVLYFGTDARVRSTRAGASQKDLVAIAIEDDAYSPPKLERILVAEDNAVNQRVALAHLQKLGYSADIATNGVEVLEALRRSDYDIVFMDCQMPQLDGYETSRRIRKLEQDGTPPFDRGAPIYIIAMTANAMTGDRQKCLDAGMSDYLSKPVRRKELETALRRRSEMQPTASGDPPVAVETVPPRFDPSPSGEVLVELDRLRDVTDDEPDQMQNLIDLYLSQAVPVLDDLEKAIQTGVSSEVERLAHKLLGASASCGVEAFTEPLRKLESLAREKDLSGGSALLDDIRQKLPRVRHVFAQFVETLQASSL